MTVFGVETVMLDLPVVAGSFGRRLREAGVPVTVERSARFACALSLVRPVSRRRLYFTARAVFVTDVGQLPAFNRTFAAVFGTQALDPEPDSIALDAPETGSAVVSDMQKQLHPQTDLAHPVLASEEERLRAKRFDELDAHELAALYRLMARMRIEAPLRRTRRARRDRHGERIDLRRTLRQSMHTGGDPIRLARKRRRIVRRRVVMLCDISGSMEPYARAYLQFLAVGAGSGLNAEAFAFATRLTRLTRALGSRNPERAIQRAAATAPDWSSGTRIGDALKTFNDQHGRRGMARGAVVVVLSDGWERGDPKLVAREMGRLRRLAHRIVWVNPRASADGFVPRAGGMAAALPHCDALVSGHSLEALEEVVAAIAGDWAGTARPPAPEPSAPETDEEPWGSATPVPGSSVAMPSGYGPSRGKTTPGWSIG